MAGGGDGRRKATLYYREGSSDKVYVAEVVRAGAGFVVKFAYGRRGRALTPGTKTPKPVGRAEADRIFSALVREKRAKGYRDAVADEHPPDPSTAGPSKSGRSRAAAAATSRADGDTSVSEGLREFDRRIASRLRAYRSALADASLYFTATLDPKRKVVLEWHRIADPAFGTLTCDGDDWRGRPRSVPGLGEAVPVAFDVPNAHERLRCDGKPPPPPKPPTAGQRRAYRTFFSDPAHYLRVVEEANWQFYLENIHEAEDFGHSKRIAHLGEPADLWRFLHSPKVTFPVQRGSGWWVELTWECEWDREHGHAVVLRNGRPNYVGQQGAF